MAKYKVKIHSRRRYKMDTIRVTRNDTIEWTAHQNSDLTLWFPPGNPFEIKGEVKVTKNKPFIIGDLSKVAPGTYEYSVFCHDDNKMADGDSPPRIIIG